MSNNCVDYLKTCFSDVKDQESFNEAAINALEFMAQKIDEERDERIRLRAGDAK